MHSLHRRQILTGTSFMLGAALASSLAPSLAMAQQGEPIRIGTLTPLTGAGGPYGPAMVKAVTAVAAQVNAAGGVLGRRIEIISEDDQTNSDAGVRAARKLIDVDKVVAILGTWASSVTTAVAPLCWEAKTFLTTVSGADSITLLPHQGYLIRTQPNTTLQGQKFGALAVAQGSRKLFLLTPQTPFAKSEFEVITSVVKAGGGDTAMLIYDDKKPSYRSEVDQALRFEPDTIMLGGYTPDTTVLVKDLYRASFAGRKLAPAYAVNQKLIDAVPPETVEGCITLAPSPAEGSPAYQDLVKLIGVASPDPYTAQIYDHINLVLLAIAQAGEASGTAIKNAIRSVSQAPGGTKIGNAPDGLKLIATRTAIDYDGASGPCDFNAAGDITDSKFRYEQVKSGKLTLLKIA